MFEGGKLDICRITGNMEGECCSDSFRLANRKEADCRSAKRPVGPRESPPDIEIQIPHPEAERRDALWVSNGMFNLFP